MYMYVRMCCTHTYICMYVYTCAYYVRMYVYLHAYVHAYMRMCNNVIHTYIRTQSGLTYPHTSVLDEIVDKVKELDK